MSKYLKRYNEETGKWELISAPDVSVVQQLEDGSDITDTNVVITNVNYAGGESGETTLNETLTVISDDISRLERNVSWLAEHGGGGGTGGGTGGTAAFGIEIISPVLTDNAAYVSGKTFEIEFMITGGTDGEECQYAYVYDSNPQTNYVIAEVNKSIKILIDNTSSDSKEHSIIIRAINPYGTNISPKSFRIYESTLTLAFDYEAAGKDYADGIFNIRRNSTYAYIPLLITNGLMNSRTVLTARHNEDTKSIEFTNETTSSQPILFSLWDIIPVTMVESGQYYVVTFNTSATLGTTTINSNEIQVRIRIVSPSEITVILGVNGTSGEHIDVALNSSIVYNFKVYVPTVTPPIEQTYYSAKIDNGSTSHLILGQYYDENTKAEGATSYLDNDSVNVGTTVSSQYLLSASEFNVGDNIQLYVKVWNPAGDRIATAMTEITVVDESNEVFQPQSNLRGGSTGTGNTVYLSWDKRNAIAMQKLKWTSKRTDYAFMDGDLAESEHNTVIADINVLNANNSSGIDIDPDGTPRLRLQNRAYAVANLIRYTKETQLITGEHSENYGFTISFTFEQDVHNDTKHTLLLWGKNASDGTLTDGIRIDSDKAYWAVNERTAAGNIKQTLLSCPITSKSRITVDFSYVRTPNSATVRIYLNGILNDAADINVLSPQYTFPDEIYFGANYRNNTVERFSDLRIYGFSVYTRALNDLQIVVNGKYSRYTTLEEYNSWKDKNFITAKATDIKTPESVFFDNGNYKTNFDAQQINNIAQRSTIPTMWLNFGTNAEFTSSYFYEKHVSTDTGRTFVGTATYYDPSTKGTADNISILVSLQGTSTLGYRIKNLELYINETFVKDGQTYIKLFQPKENWFPESQFTLKADVVDSAHANNAVLGEWINNCGVFEDNPAMQEFGSNRPIDMDDSGTAMGIDNDVTIKHTLEGFPILMFIKFSDNNTYTFLGIYSFNLGRYSYYNMGMKFLKGFSRRDGLGPSSRKVACPKVINYYEEMENLGNVLGSNIYSFELGNAGNGKIADYPVWSQFSKSVVKSYGDFKYPNIITENIWDKLCLLFKAFAQFKVTDYYGDLYNKYDGIKYYEINSQGNYETDGSVIAQQNDSAGDIEAHLNIKNAAAYFVIANAFGMTDSLGKNLTLRTWDGGEKWYCCFYDMDTALALANDGSESNPVTVAIDKVEMISDPETSTSILKTTYHDENSKYAAVLSKIWGVLRDSRFIYVHGNEETERYEYIWGDLRKLGGKLSSSSNFTNIMEERVNSCGEMIYDYDYNTKYIQDTTAAESGATAAITFLHGTRVEYVKDWLRKHFYFLDGLFDVDRLSLQTPFTFDDSPYNTDIFTLVVSYSSTIPVLAYTVQVATPSFIGLTVGNDSFKKYYIANENVDTTIYLVNGTSANSQLVVKGSSILTKFDGLQGGFMAIGSNSNGVAKSLSVFDISSSNALNEDPFSKHIFGNESSLEKVNFSNTHGINTLAKYQADFEGLNKLIDINISNSDVTSLNLPETAIQNLSFFNSNITNFTLRNQNIINELNFNGCNKLQTITVDNCNAITSVTIDNKPLLGTVSIQNNALMKSIDIVDCPALQTVNIYNMPQLEHLTVKSDFGMGAVGISIYGCPNLKEIRVNNVYSAQTITIDTASAANVATLNLDNFYYFSGFKFNGQPVETYGEDNDFVLDITPFSSLTGERFSTANLLNVHYIRVKNEINNPFNIKRSVTQGSKNSLTRIFGHFSITDADQFMSCTKFYLREPVEKIDNETPFDDQYYQWGSGIYDTNITVSISNLSNAFRYANCSLSDVYYLFKRAKHGVATVDVETVAGAFASCKNVVTTMEDKLNPHIFEDMPLLSNIDNLFDGATIGGYIDNSLLTPIAENLENFVNVFGSNEWNIDKYYTKDDECFFPEGNKIKTVVGFNPLPYNTDYQEPNPVYDTEILRTLTEVELIDNSFNDCMIDFANGGDDPNCDLFRTTTKLKKIRQSFLRIVGWGSLRNIFGGNSSSENEYPQALESVINSFSFLEGNEVYPSDHEFIADNECPFTDDWAYGSHPGVLMPIGNSFFKKIKNTIKCVGGKDNSYYFEKCFYAENVNEKPGNGLRKYLDLTDCDGENFCYKIFDGCTNLEEIPYFFEGMDFKIEGFSNATPLSILFAPNGRSIFSGLTKLRNINGIFANMKNLNFVLSSGCAFEDCAIELAAYAFRESSENNAAKRVGMIPYKLFYQGDVENSISGDKYGITKEIADTLGILSDFEDYIANSGNPSDYHYEGSDTTDKFMLNFTYRTPKCLITDLSNIFENSNSTAITVYSASGTVFSDWIEDNENYNPLMFYVVENESGATYTYNMNYEPFKKKWNKFVYDGTQDFTDKILNSAEYQKLVNLDPEYLDEYGNPILNKDLPDSMKDYDSTLNLEALSVLDTGIERLSDYDPVYTGLFSMQNYFCPQDIFRYCLNGLGTMVNDAFENGCPNITATTNTWSCGMKGRIPPYIFEPLTNIMTLTTVFAKCRALLPHRWAIYGNNKEYIGPGVTYPPTLFNGLAQITTCSSMFSHGTVWGRTVVPSGLFASNLQLSSVTSLWSQVNWVETNAITLGAQPILQFPADLFYNNSKLTNISNMFSEGGPVVMTQGLFSSVNNPRINNTSGFLYRCRNLNANYSRVPEFWNNWTVQVFANTFFGISQDIITAQHIPEPWYIESN